MIVTSGNRFVIFNFSYFTFKYIISALLLKSFIVAHILMNTHLQLHEIVLKVPLHFYPHTISMNVYSLFFRRKQLPLLKIQHFLRSRPAHLTYKFHIVIHVRFSISYDILIKGLYVFFSYIKNVSSVWKKYPLLLPS